LHAAALTVGPPELGNPTPISTAATSASLRAFERQHQPKRYANLQQVFLALRRFDTLGRDVPAGRLVLRWQMLLD
jgi:hypothetical protein